MFRQCRELPHSLYVNDGADHTRREMTLYLAWNLQSFCLYQHPFIHMHASDITVRELEPSVAGFMVHYCRPVRYSLVLPVVDHGTEAQHALCANDLDA